MQSSSATPIWNRFGIGLVAGFALVGAILCLVAFLFVRPELNVGPSPAWTPPAVALAPTDTPAPPSVQGAEPRLAVGRRGQVISAAAVNLRRTPGYLNKPAGDVLGTVLRGATVDIIGGPQSVDNLTWWQVRAGDRAGWMAETRASGESLLQPAP
ncbi:hypothetical protein [Candidatus Amarolinea aalborgensis]|uniref:hypothetical protein n=1 Tax=Candidatus Amarolinea aalborgensis TaxID=2249329 RepID=UPI003BF9D0D6